MRNEVTFSPGELVEVVFSRNEIRHAVYIRRAPVKYMKFQIPHEVFFNGDVFHVYDGTIRKIKGDKDE